MADKSYNALKGNVRELVKTRQGREFIWWVLEQTGIYNCTFMQNSSSFFQEGRRSVGLNIIELLTDVDPTIYPRLLMEKAKQD
jgi:hypothetical protein